jgi:steroid delta-isomerase-like uncharacterized protein
MSVDAENNKKLVSNFIELTWNQGRFHLAKSLLGRDFTYYASMINDPMGIDAMEVLIQQIRGCMEDFSISIEEIVAEGNLIVTQSTFSGTLIKPLMGFHPVDKMVALHAATFWKVRHGQIVEGNSLLDTGDLFQQVYRIVNPGKAIAF